MENCIFCKIIAGDIPCYKVYEDQEFLGFLDITPRNKGHALLIPKKHYRWVWDIQENYSNPANKIATALKKAFDTDLIVSFMIGNEVEHAHIHLVPRFEGDGHGALINESLKREVSKEEMTNIAKKISESVE